RRARRRSVLAAEDVGRDQERLRTVRSRGQESAMSAMTKRTSAEVRKKQSEYVFPSVATYYAESVVLEQGKGSRVTDLDGKTYLDFFGGILTLSVGHCNERVN